MARTRAECSPSPCSYVSYDLLGFLIPPDAKNIVSPSFKQLQATLNMLQEQFSTQSPPKSQYLHVSHLEQDIFGRILNDENKFRGARATVSYETNEILYKVIPAQHHQSSELFIQAVAERLPSMGLKGYRGHRVSRGSARTAGWTCGKEPDWWFGPNNTLVNGDGDYPSLVLEVGLTQSYGQLRNDAYWWHGNSDMGSSDGDRKTKVVLLMTTTCEPSWRLDIETWTEVPNTQPMRNTRSRSFRILERTQHVYFENGAVHGGTLVLSFELMMRRRPTEKEADIVLDDEMISAVYAQVLS
ncbi:hypothetical protein N7494_010279 [Penicillium frequentans]|uniref:Uncharacterized protein n=1 Tax=Penicillium frequentans TaxID=3151616 RepID=A0AAD6CRJ1_9EURO|nr:hypothetical protein N7494_010279 [Penicillium glabrum]